MELAPWMVGLLGFFLLFTLMFLRVPVAFAFAISGFIGLWYVRGLPAALGDLPVVVWSTSSEYVMICIPLFILMSAFVSRSGIAREAYDTARAWFGHIRGGLAMASVGACGLFAATTGSSMACAVAMGKVAYPEMERNNYAATLASGCIVAGGSLGILIPPSISFVVIGILTEVSIGKLFMAGIIPGILELITA